MLQGIKLFQLFLPGCLCCKVGLHNQILGVFGIAICSYALYARPSLFPLRHVFDYMLSWEYFPKILLGCCHFAAIPVIFFEPASVSGARSPKARVVRLWSGERITVSFTGCGLRDALKQVTLPTKDDSPMMFSIVSHCGRSTQSL